MALLTIVLAAVVFNALRSREPVYQDRPLSAWLDDLMMGHYGAQHDAAEEAIWQIGTNAIPHLLRRVAAVDSWTQRKLQSLNRRQSLIHFPVHYASDGREPAKRAFEALSARAKPAIPDLLRIAQTTDDKDVAEAARSIVERIKPVIANTGVTR